MTIRCLRAATLAAADPEASAATYVRWMDYRILERGLISADLARSWGCPAAHGRSYVIAGPASGAPVLLRFVRSEPVGAYLPLRTFGWAAAEICVQDVMAANERMKGSPFAVIGPPKENPGLQAIKPMQVRGIDNEIVYLTEICDDAPGYRLPRAGAFIDKIFIMVLACADLEASLDWFHQALGLTRAQDMTIVYSMINAAFDLPRDTRHRLATMTDGVDLQLELDQYPDGATPRPGRPGDLPPGLAMTTFLHDAIDAIQADWIQPPARREGILYAGARSGVLRGPDGVLVEVVEAA